MLLKDVVKMLGDIYEPAEVAKEAIAQCRVHEVERIQLLFPRMPRINAASIALNVGLKEAKDWVEANFSDTGNGDPV